MLWRVSGAGNRLPSLESWMNGWPLLRKNTYTRDGPPSSRRKRYLRRLTSRKGWIFPFTVNLSPRIPSRLKRSKKSCSVVGSNVLSMKTIGMSNSPLGSLRPVPSSPVSRSMSSLGTGSVSCYSACVLHLCRFLHQEELMEREAMVQNPSSHCRDVPCRKMHPHKIMHNPVDIQAFLEASCVL